MSLHYPDQVELSYKGQTLANNKYYQEYIDIICTTYLKGNIEASICEWGAGFSTFRFYNMLEEGLAKHVASIDNNKDYAECFWQHLPVLDGFYPVVRNEIGPTSGNTDVGLHYASHPTVYGLTFDLIFIDGRRRMECALNCLLFCSPRTKIIVDDGLRSRYQVAQLLFDQVAILEHGVVYKVKDAIYSSIQADKILILNELAQQGLVDQLSERQK